jgi:AmmeMemoRadiSam system protein A
MAPQQPKTIHSFTASQKRDLLRFARETIATHLAGSNPPPVEALGLNEVFVGVFVSLHVDQLLRGCIGYVEGLRPLPEVVQETAIAAALRDPRFEPLEAEELDRVEIEISILSPLRKIETLSEIELGRHGLMIRFDKQQGLLLPQVAVHNNWDTETFLAHVCLKAGLSPGAWKEQNKEIYVFEAEVFSDVPKINLAE